MLLESDFWFWHWSWASLGIFSVVVYGNVGATPFYQRGKKDIGVMRYECWGPCLLTAGANLTLSESFFVPFLPPFCMALKFPQQQMMTSILNSLIFLGMKEACKSFDYIHSPGTSHWWIKEIAFSFLSEPPFKSSWWIGLVFRAMVGFCWRGLVKLPQRC